MSDEGTPAVQTAVDADAAAAAAAAAADSPADDHESVEMQSRT